MDTRKELASIQEIEIGYGGYQSAMMGISIQLGGPNCGVGDFKGCWAEDPDKHSRWSKSDQDKSWADMIRWLRDTMEEAKVSSMDGLKGKPVEITFEGNTLKSWRILREVIG